MSIEIADLRRQMEEQQLSQAAVAARAGVSPSTLSRILDGKTQNARQATMERIKAAVQAEALHIQSSMGTQEALPIFQALKHHRAVVQRWSSTIDFRDLLRSRNLSKSFIDLHVTRVPSTWRNPTLIHLSDLLKGAGHCVLLGAPGAGKTTSLKYIARVALDRSEQDITGTPLLVSLRETSAAESLYQILGAIFRMDFDGLDAQLTARYRLLDVLESVKPIILLDGLDEVGPHWRRQIVDEFRFLIEHARDFRVFLTCRTGDYSYHFDNVEVFQIHPLDRMQVHEFAHAWLGASAEDFLSQLTHSPFADTTVRPLTIAHLCAIYERRGMLPEQPRTIYRKVVRLLLEEWDEQRSIRRTSRYANFEVDRKEELLQAVAFQVSLLGAYTFSHDQLEHVYRAVAPAFGLPANDAVKVASELESHTGLFVESGYDQYSFAHKSIQEYLTAEYLIRLPGLPRGILLRFPSECAIAVALSSNPTEYFLLPLLSVESDAEKELDNAVAMYLRRLVIEGVYFIASPRLGWAILGLYAYASRNDTSRTWMSENIFELTSVESVAESVRAVLRDSIVTRDNSGFWFIRPESGATLPAIRWLFESHDVTLRIDDEFVRRLG